MPRNIGNEMIFVSAAVGGGEADVVFIDGSVTVI